MACMHGQVTNKARDDDVEAGQWNEPDLITHTLTIQLHCISHTHEYPIDLGLSAPCQPS